jgi:hypothetical protein
VHSWIFWSNLHLQAHQSMVCKLTYFFLQINDMFRRQKSTVRCTRYRHICLDKAHVVQSDYVANINFLFGECFHYLTFEILPCHDLYVNVSMCHYRYEFGFPAVEKARGYTQFLTSVVNLKLDGLYKKLV